MAARLNPRHQDMVRDKIQATQLINRLQAHCLGELSLSLSQVQVIALLVELKLGKGPGRKAVRLWGGKRNAQFGNCGIYIASAVGSGRYKIGWSKDVKARMAELYTGCPFELEVLNVIEAEREAEGWLHARFKQHRVTGEWFELPQGAVDFLCSLKPAEVCEQKQSVAC